MISLIVKECLCGCGLLIDDCTFQQKMRAFGLVEIADAASREVIIPPLGEDEAWISLTGSQKSL